MNIGSSPSEPTFGMPYDAMQSCFQGDAVIRGMIGHKLRGSTLLSVKGLGSMVVPALASAMALAGAVILVSTIRLVWQGWLPMPFGDQWQQLVAEHGLDLTWLTSMHNEHRIAVPRIIFLLDSLMSRERNAVDLAANLLMPAAFAGLLIDLLRRGPRISTAVEVVLASLAIALAFWAIQWENFIWGFQVQIFGVVLGTTFVLHRVAFGGTSWASLTMIVLAMVATALTLSTGFFAAVLAVPVAWRVGRSRRDVVLLASTAAVLLALAVASLDRAGSSSGGGVTALRHLPEIATHAIAALGGPVGEGSRVLTSVDDVTVSYWAGLFGLLTFAGLILRDVFGSRSPRSAMLSGLAVFGVLSAVSTAFGRWSLGPAQALSSRYATPVLAFWLALCFLLSFGADRMRGRAAIALAAALAGLALVSQGEFVSVAEQAIDSRAEAMPALAAGVSDPTALHDSGMAGPDPLTHLAALKTARASLFAEPWLGWSGERLADHATPADPSRCAGRIGEVEVAATGRWEGSRVHGTVRLVGDQRPRRLVLTDDAGTVVGYGIVPPFQEVAGNGGIADWTGDATVRPGQGLIAYVLLSDGSACRLVRSMDASIVKAALSAPPPGTLADGGVVEDEASGDGTFILEGWAMVGSEADREGEILVDTDLPVAKLSVRPERRPEVADYMHDPRLDTSGFKLTIRLKLGVPLPARPHLCLWTDDAGYGPRRLVGIRPDLCPEL